MSDKITVGLIEPIRVKAKKQAELLGKFDTGARRTSIDRTIAKKIKAKPIGRVKVENVHGQTRRPLAEVTLKIKGKRIKTKANIADRSSRKYKAIIGRDVIFSNFIIDITKSHTSPDLGDVE